MSSCAGAIPSSLQGDGIGGGTSAGLASGMGGIWFLVVDPEGWYRGGSWLSWWAWPGGIPGSRRVVGPGGVELVFFGRGGTSFLGGAFGYQGFSLGGVALVGRARGGMSPGDLLEVPAGRAASRRVGVVEVGRRRWLYPVPGGVGGGIPWAAAGGLGVVCFAGGHVLGGMSCQVVVPRRGGCRRTGWASGGVIPSAADCSPRRWFLVVEVVGDPCGAAARCPPGVLGGCTVACCGGWRCGGCPEAS